MLVKVGVAPGGGGADKAPRRYGRSQRGVESGVAGPVGVHIDETQIRLAFALAAPSWVVLLKNSMRKLVLAVLLSEPMTWSCVLDTT